MKDETRNHSNGKIRTAVIGLTTMVLGAAIIGGGSYVFSVATSNRTEVRVIQTELAGIRDQVQSLRAEMKDGFKDLKTEIRKGS